MYDPGSLVSFLESLHCSHPEYPKTVSYFRTLNHPDDSDGLQGIGQAVSDVVDAVETLVEGEAVGVDSHCRAPFTSKIEGQLSTILSAGGFIRSAEFR